MANLSPHKSFPGYTGVEVPAEVIVSRPIPRREVPLEGTKTMVFPAKPMEIQLGAEIKTPWNVRSLFRLFVFWLLIVPLGVVLFLSLAALLFMVLTASYG